jgi:phage terminase large subunit GpA-like protein
LLFDTNHTKTFVAERLRTPVGDPGAVTFHQGQHTMLVDHLTAEQPIAVTARGRTVDEWKLLPARENHFLDCLSMATTAASVAGITAVGAEPMRRMRRKVEIPRAGERKVIQVRRL